jgi:DNA-binding CsgD family transcriptional regulator
MRAVTELSPGESRVVRAGDLRVAVLGSPRVVADAIAEVLGSSAVTPEGSATVDQADVAVLVDPDDKHWLPVSVAGCPVLVLHSTVLDDAHVVDAVVKGAVAFAPLEIDVDDLVDLVHRVADGKVLLDPHQCVVVVQALRAHHHAAITLTEREAEILHLVDEGNSVKQTAKSLGISPKTVENIQRHLFQKLGVRNRSQAVAKAHALGLLARSA